MRCLNHAKSACGLRVLRVWGRKLHIDELKMNQNKRKRKMWEPPESYFIVLWTVRVALLQGTTVLPARYALNVTHLCESPPPPLEFPLTPMVSQTEASSFLGCCSFDFPYSTSPLPLPQTLPVCLSDCWQQTHRAQFFPLAVHLRIQTSHLQIGRI